MAVRQLIEQAAGKAIEKAVRQVFEQAGPSSRQVEDILLGNRAGSGQAVEQAFEQAARQVFKKAIG
jgi:hypothetical protein